MAVKAAYDFWQEIESIHGTYYSAVLGLAAHAAAFDKHVRANRPRASEQEIRNVQIYYGRSDEGGLQDLDHTVSLGKFLERNRPNGENVLSLGASCIVTIYAYWEDKYRSAIARELDIAPNLVIVPIMGDLRLLRHAILHRTGDARQDASKLEVVDWLDADGVVRVTIERYRWLTQKILAFVHSADGLRSSPSKS